MSDATQATEPVDLDWQAFRYIACEMTAEELAAFEQDLAESQPAREAVAAAVLLAQAVAVVERNQTASARSGLVHSSLATREPAWRSRLVWALVGAAASLLIAGGLQMWRDSRQVPNMMAQARPASREDLNALALQWTAAGDFDVDLADDSNVASRDSDEPMGQVQTHVTVARELFDDLVAPDWLLSAVSSDQHLPMAQPMQNPDG